MKVPIEHAAVEASTTIEALVRAIDEGTIEGWRFAGGLYVDTDATLNLDLPVASWWRIKDYAKHWNTSYDMARRRLLTTPHVNVLDTYYYPAPVQPGR
ncbi:MAG: hypothetical protein R2770_00815 [Acidimicrobiales bacterium]